MAFYEIDIKSINYYRLPDGRAGGLLDRPAVDRVLRPAHPIRHRLALLLLHQLAPREIKQYWPLLFGEIGDDITRL